MVKTFNLLQFSKAQKPIVDIVTGIETDDNSEQPPKAKLSMLVTPSEIETSVNIVQPKNAEEPIRVTRHPPRLEGTLIAPVVVVGIAEEVPFPIEAVLPDRENVHSTPSTTSVSALTEEIKKARQKEVNHFMT